MVIFATVIVSLFFLFFLVGVVGLVFVFLSAIKQLFWDFKKVDLSERLLTLNEKEILIKLYGSNNSDVNSNVKVLKGEVLPLYIDEWWYNPAGHFLGVFFKVFGRIKVGKYVFNAIKLPIKYQEMGAFKKGDFAEVEFSPKTKYIWKFNVVNST